MAPAPNAKSGDARSRIAGNGEGTRSPAAPPVPAMVDGLRRGAATALQLAAIGAGAVAWILMDASYRISGETDG
jgi:hypothetical protein